MIIIKFEYLKDFQDQDHSKTSWVSKWKIKSIKKGRRNLVKKPKYLSHDRSKKSAQIPPPLSV